MKVPETFYVVAIRQTTTLIVAKMRRMWRTWDLVNFICLWLDAIYRTFNRKCKTGGTGGKVYRISCILDTKSEESKFVKDLLEKQNVREVTIDIGTGLEREANLCLRLLCRGCCKSCRYECFGDIGHGQGDTG